jgi:ATP adenylyltransferase
MDPTHKKLETELHDTQPVDMTPPGVQRLWAPWRMRYVGGGAAEPGCLFCNRLAAEDDVHSLILSRGELAFVIMNLFPYNTGHVMIVPNDHVASPEDASLAALAAMGELLQPTLRALRRVLNCEGFNVGINVGAVAGAGVADHLHQHVVPRWQGDANFMPILATTMVLPEMIPVTYAKLRAEIGRELAGGGEKEFDFSVVVLSHDRASLLLEETANGWSPPVITAAPGIPIWTAAAGTVGDWGIAATIAGWAGAERTSIAEPIALSLRADQATPPHGPRRVAWVEVTSHRFASIVDQNVVKRAIRCLD